MENQIREIGMKIQNEERIDDKILKKINEYPKIRFGIILITLIGMNYYLFYVGIVYEDMVGWFLHGLLFFVGSSIVMSKKPTIIGKIVECIDYSWTFTSMITLVVATASEHLNFNKFECILIWSLWLIGYSAVWGSNMAEDQKFEREQKFDTTLI